MVDVDAGGYAPGVAARLSANWRILSNLYLDTAPPRDPWNTFAEWRPVALACLARGHYAQQSVFALHPHAPFDAAVLSRVAFEHLVVFAWLLIAPEKHHAMLLRSEHDHVRDFFNDVAEQSGQQFPGKDAHLSLLATLASADRIPRFVKCAAAADDHWGKVMPSRNWGFRQAYANQYRPYSALVHPLLSGFHPFLQSRLTGVEASTVPDNSRAPAHLLTGATPLLASALFVCSHTFGWPPKEAIRQAATHGLRVEDGSIVLDEGEGK